MQTRPLKITAVMLLSLLFVAPASAQPGDPGSEDGQNRRTEMLDKIRMVRMYSLIEALELDEAKAAKLFPYLRKHDGTLETLQQNKHKSHRALRKMVKNDSFDEKAAEEHFAVILKADAEIAKTERMQLEGLKGILSVEQRVKFLLAKPSFERKIREMMRDERQRRRGKRGERGERGDKPMGGPPPGR
jgi:Spy/CpxP family protein refolding chaperone